jgi:hypothetical protein
MDCRPRDGTTHTQFRMGTLVYKIPRKALVVALGDAECNGIGLCVMNDRPQRSEQWLELCFAAFQTSTDDTSDVCHGRGETERIRARRPRMIVSCSYVEFYCLYALASEFR